MLKYLLLLLLLSLTDLSVARVTKNKVNRKHKRSSNSSLNKKKSKIKPIALNSTAVSICKRNLIVNNKNLVENNKFVQAVIVAIETSSETNCKLTGKNKAEQYIRNGWKCEGINKEDLFSCENKSSSSFMLYKNVVLDHLLFTNLEKHHALIAYVNPNSYDICLEDKGDIESGGVKDAVCSKGSRSSTSTTTP